ncbi:Coenzyme F420 hydrogenase/dehydrogenase, beta subunit C-terminal domain [Blautia wexlerae]|uniref:Coenzyme F420 hydrogenase/dehydrogenase, beta subunit C-terminal domain n=1 Tax=Blautia wexlerae TaxID=418240 RepID=UPI00189A8E73|nr:Coenzyme F420 hydrogenase/dehydrogenase, beta subunit C-terminal domain [Blautia wexlerae]
MLITEHELCTGCGVCANICPQKAIKMTSSKRGFLYPAVDDNICIHCNRCIKQCPVKHDNVAEEMKKKVCAVWSKDNETRIKSSSGGFFMVAAKYILSNGGAVCATRFSDDFSGVFFDICESESELYKFRGSKYVQSNLNPVYSRVKDLLDNKRLVLFVGTGCQVAAIKSYLGREYDNLLCMDLVCHGVPSPMIWKEYIQSLNTEYGNSGVKSISFRVKRPSWKEYSLEVIFNNGQKYIKSKTQDPYLIAFGKDIILRPSCEHCKYACLKREGDITISDFWAYRSFDFKTRNDETGISCCIINSQKGIQLFELLRNELVVVEKGMDEAIRGNRNLIKPWFVSERADEFWNLYDKKGIDALIQYCQPFRISKKMKMDWFKQDHLWLIPKPVLKMILKQKS